MKPILKINQISELIKDSLPNEKVKTIGEISQLRIFRGNYYITLKDKFSTLKTIIWSSKISNDIEIKEGDKVTLEGKLDFYGGNGSLSLIVSKILGHSGEGELFKLFNQYKNKFEKDGYFDRKLKLKKKIKKILLLTSEQGAAVQDFIFNLDNHNSKIKYKLMDIPVQGNDCPNRLISYLKDIQNKSKKYDLVVITRGGGSFEDLFGFSKPELVETIYNFHLPVLSAIGHQVDTSLLDLVSDYTAPTPSLAAQFIIDYNRNYLSNFTTKLEIIRNDLLDYFNDYLRKIREYNDRLSDIIMSFEEFKLNYQKLLVNQLGDYSIKLKHLEIKLDNLLDNGNMEYPIIKLNNKGINIDKFIELLKEGEDFEIEWKGHYISISDYDYSYI